MRKLNFNRADFIALAVFVGLGILFNTPAFAITAPTSGSFAYDVYDIAVNKILQGPIGFVGGVATIVYGAIVAARGQLLGGVAPMLAGAALLKSASIVQSLGAVI